MADAQSMALLLAEGESAKAKSLHDWLDARANDNANIAARTVLWRIHFAHVAAAEGCPCYVCGRIMDGRSEDDCHCFHRTGTRTDYRDLWDSINGHKPEMAWDANPWVWVVEFRRAAAAMAVSRGEKTHNSTMEPHKE